MAKKQFNLRRVSGAPVTDEELLSDLRSIASALGGKTVQQKRYRELGKLDDTTISRRFGSWNEALRKADLELSNENNISDERLYENILQLWQHFGRQPRRRELTDQLSNFSQSPYNRRFGSWTAALESFVEYANAPDTGPIEINGTTIISQKRITGRDPSLRLRFKVLRRDNFTCRHCGASPAKTVCVELHVDHIVPWSKGGETLLENLQTLCKECNLGKSNLNEK